MQRNDMNYDQAATKIQSLVRGVLTRVRVTKLMKDLFKRRMIVKQLLETEQNYIKDLSLVISDFQVPLMNKKIITKQESQIIFINIDQIKRLNQLFFATIFDSANNYWHYKIIFQKVEKEVHFFKLYFDYFNNYTASSNKIDELMQYKNFENFINEARLKPHHKLLSLKDYLIKPVQRLPKYVLIMKQIKKRTTIQHPDYKNIDKVLKLFQFVNQSNNQKLNRVLNTYKINQIQKKLNLPHMISQPGTQFILQQPVTVVNNQGHTIQATLYLLNTQIIIARKTGDRKQKFMLAVPFKNGGADIIYNQQHYFYKDTFTVQNGEGDSCMFYCTDEEQRDSLIQKIFNQLMKAQQRTLEKLSTLCNIKNKQGVQFLKKMTRLDLIPDILILGTDQRNDNMFKYTVYIIQIRIKSIKHKVFLRFRELIQLQEQLKIQYGFRIKNQLTKSLWVTNHKPKRIEERKIAIQKFLKQILSKQEVIERGEEILQKLGLPPDFYRLPDYFKENEQLKKSGLFQRQTSQKTDNIERSILGRSKNSIFASLHDLEEQEQQQRQTLTKRKSKRLSIQDILKANQLHLGHFTRYTQIMYPKGYNDQDIIVDILIPWIQNEKGFVKQRLYMKSNQRVVNLIENLSKQIGLKYYKDFRINLERQYAGRILDDDECLPKILQQMKCGKYLLIFKKTIYIAPDIEQHQIRNDRIRLKIIASQIIYQCKKDKYLLDYKLILRLSVFIGILQSFCDQEEKDQQSIKKILQDQNLAINTRGMITSQFTSFYDGPQTWKKDYHKTFKLILNKIQDISRRNIHVFRNSGLQSEQKLYNTTQISQLAAYSIIMQIKNNIFYGSISFIVQISQWFRQFLMKYGQQNQQIYDNRNCWLIIKYNQLHLYSINLKICIFSFNYNQLYKIQPYPSSILLHLRQKQVDLIKLKTTNSYSIRQILLYYKNYNDIISKIQQEAAYQDSIVELTRQQLKNTMSFMKSFKQ